MASTLLAGCDIFHSKDIPDRIVKLDQKDPDPLVLRPISIRVITPENQKETFVEMQSLYTKPVVIGMTPQDYKDWQYNSQKIENYIRELQLTIYSYRSYYEGEK